MVERETITAADVGVLNLAPPTLNARLHALVAKINPAALASHDKDGSWPGGVCPFVIDETAKGQRVRVFDEDGSTQAGVGATVEAALTALEGKQS